MYKYTYIYIKINKHIKSTFVVVKFLNLTIFIICTSGPHPDRHLYNVILKVLGFKKGINTIPTVLRPVVSDVS